MNEEEKDKRDANRNDDEDEDDEIGISPEMFFFPFPQVGLSCQPHSTSLGLLSSSLSCDASLSSLSSNTSACQNNDSKFTSSSSSSSSTMSNMSNNISLRRSASGGSTIASKVSKLGSVIKKGDKSNESGEKERRALSHDRDNTKSPPRREEAIPNSAGSHEGRSREGRGRGETRYRVEYSKEGLGAESVTLADFQFVRHYDIIAPETCANSSVGEGSGGGGGGGGRGRGESTDDGEKGTHGRCTVLDHAPAVCQALCKVFSAHNSLAQAVNGYTLLYTVTYIHTYI